MFLTEPSRKTIGCRKLEIHRLSGTTRESSSIDLHFGGKQTLPGQRSSEGEDLHFGEEKPMEVGAAAILFADH